MTLQTAELVAEALHALKTMTDAIDNGGIDSQELSGDPEVGIAPYKWHEEWRFNAGGVCDRLSNALQSLAGQGERVGVYVASRASVLARGAMWRSHRDAGAPIISTWIDEDGEGDTADLDELWVRIRREVTSAERLILYVEPDDFPLKGAFVEVGMALAANVPIWIVAPGVQITGRNQRPFGSWIKHPSVRFADTVAAALPAPPLSGGDR